jgi:hypothetical protein
MNLQNCWAHCVRILPGRQPDHSIAAKILPHGKIVQPQPAKLLRSFLIGATAGYARHLSKVSSLKSS